MQTKEEDVVRHPEDEKDEKDLSLKEADANGEQLFSGVFSGLSCGFGAASDDSGVVKTTNGTEPPEKEESGDRFGENEGRR